MMRVITGSARGRRLETLDGEDVTRPTTESVKEALFSMIQFEIEDKKVLDLFAGSAQLGIEALSRGARHCTFVESNRQAYKVAENNIKSCQFVDKSRLVLSDAVSFLYRKDNFDIAFLDPPYNMGLIEKCLPLLLPMMSDDGIIVCETSRNENLTQELNGWAVYRERNYGKTKLTLYRKES
ncbi:MAG: 16S rRNA (guanine(966)-N(2))-methyltransferase RsmD [Eubacterium sp.]